MTDQAALKLCIIPPARPGGHGTYRKAVQLLRHAGEAVRISVVGSGLAPTGEESGWMAFESLSGPEFEKAASDLLLCWGLPALCEALALTRSPPIVYGVAMEDLVQGALPVHPRLVGYVSDLSFHRAILTSCGIPLERQYGLAAGIDDEDDPAPSMSASGEGRGVLLLADDGPLTTAVKSACELLGLRLERLSAAAAASIPRDFFRGYACVVASGQAALRAAATGVAVVVADSRGSAGVMTPENLQSILDGDAGPACFDSSAGVETFLAALAGIGGSAPADLASILRSTHSEGARAHRFLGWLRQVRTQSRALPPDTAGTPWPRMLSMEAMLSLGAIQVGFGQPEKPIDPAPAPVPEVLAAPVQCDHLATAVRLPMDRWISAADATLKQGFFGAGWSFGESWGRWTDGDAAVLEFECEPAESGMELQLRIQIWIPPGRRYQRATVIVNKHPLLSWKLDGRACDTPYCVPLFGERLGAARSWRIEFSLPDADSPFSWGRGDSRKLGFGLVRLRLAKPG